MATSLIGYALRASSSAFASLRSGVSKPSVNQPQSGASRSRASSRRSRLLIKPSEADRSTQLRTRGYPARAQPRVRCGKHARFPPSLAMTGVEVIRRASGGAQHRPNVRRNRSAAASAAASISRALAIAPVAASASAKQAENHQLGTARARCQHRRDAFTDPFDGGCSLPALQPWRRLGGSSRNLERAQIHAPR